ncbi:MAG: transcription termination/antitermination protein NusG [Myxococcota bacterium]|nr:transcription termination/antitermination protein NusG [Myxococcota bacterium]
MSTVSKKQWYTVQTHSKFEEEVKSLILQHKEKEPHQAGKYIGDILFRKGFSGYIFIQMEMCPESWQFVRSIPKVSGFVGGRHHRDIQPVSQLEIDRIIEENAEHTEREKQSLEIPNFEVGNEVLIKSGPFEGYPGVVSEISSKAGNEDPKLKTTQVHVSLTIFNREMTIELESSEVELVKN